MYKSKEIAQMANGTLQGDGNKTVSRLCTDSRALSLPEETLFIAIKTSRGDGDRFIDNLYRNNVRTFMVNEMKDEYKALKDADFIIVDDTLKALQTLATQHRSKFNVPVIGITGSNGKTIVKEWLYQLLHDDYDITRSPRSFNSQIGVPFSVWEMDSNTQIGIFEAGISQMNEMEKLENIIKPEIGIFTNLGDAHQEHFASLKAKCSEKTQNCSKAARPSSTTRMTKLIDICMQQARLKANLLTFGKGNEADIHIEDIQKDGQKTTICYTYKGKKDSYEIPFIDHAAVENSLQCLATLLLLGVKNSTIRQRMENLESVAMRLEVKEGQKGCIVNQRQLQLRYQLSKHCP
jgi:UDP-N-acetylmuramyl pentapeptide synthase